MDVIWEMYRSVEEKYGNFGLTFELQSKLREKLFKAAYEQRPKLLMWSNGKTDEILEAIRTGNPSINLLLFSLMRFGNVHEQFIYARQSTAHRIIESLHSFLILVNHNKVTTAAIHLRLILENIATFDKVLRKTQYTVSKIEKKLNQMFNNQINNMKFDLKRDDLLDIQNKIDEIGSDLTSIVSETFVDWYEYSSSGTLQKHEVKEGYFDPSPHMGYSDSIEKIETNIKPHIGEKWGMIYTFLCDFTHPSIGSRISGHDTNNIKIHNIGEVLIRELTFSFNLEKNIFSERIAHDLINISLDLLKIYLDINVKFEELYIRLKKVSQAVVRANLFYKNKQNPDAISMLKQIIPPYNECICFSSEKFKFCCGNLKNWIT